MDASKAAIRLTKICDTFSEIHGTERFPVNVEELSLEAAELFKWADPIVKIEPVDIKGFDGALMANESRSRWMLLYNNGLTSPGRIRFTQAHELGHYILHRLIRDEFNVAVMICYPGKIKILNQSRFICFLFTDAIQ